MWIGQAVSLLGSSLVQFALVWWLTDTTGSVAVLATATFVAIIPEVVLSPFAGALVDRWNRKRVMIIADGIIAGVTLLLALLFWAGLIQPWHVYLAMFLRALGGAFHFPAVQASTSLMVPEEHLARIQGLNQTLRGLMSIGAPPLAALLVALLPTQGILAIDIVTAMIAISLVLTVTVPQPVNMAAGEAITPRLLWRDVVHGYRFMRSWTGMFALLIMATLLNFIFAPAGTLIPLLVKNHFQGDAGGVALMETLFGIGMVFGGLTLGAWGGFKRKILTSLVGLIGMGVGVSLVGFAPPDAFWMALAGHVVLGMMSPMVNGPIFAILQARVPPEMQGRVFTLVSSIAGAMMPLSMVALVPVTQLLGLQAWYLVAGAACVAMSLVGLLTPLVIRIEDEKPPLLAQS
jgi:DHA3 family macrolide efflux protein-like MFS transporter